MEIVAKFAPLALQPDLVFDIYDICNSLHCVQIGKLSFANVSYKICFILWSKLRQKMGKYLNIN